MREKFECICNNCSKLFESEDQEMILCPKCWSSYLERQLKSQDRIELSKEFLEQLLKE